MVNLADKIEQLPGDLYGIKSTYFADFARISSMDIPSAAVVLGKAGERLAKGILRDHEVSFDEFASFDILLKQLAIAVPNPSVTVGLRTVLKYRNQAAHDSGTTLSLYDLDAALSAFCSAYQSASSSARVSSQGSRHHAQDQIQIVDSTWNPTIKRIVVPVTIAAVCMLLWAVFRGGDYTFFLLLRVVVTMNAVLLARMTYRKIPLIAAILIATALLFNPIIPVYLSRGVWRWLDVGAAVLLAGSAALLRMNFDFSAKRDR